MPMESIDQRRRRLAALRPYFTAGLVWSLVLLGLASVTAVWIMHRGVSTRVEPTPAEAWLARGLRHLAVPSSYRELANPVASSSTVVAEGMAHWADHCATCHGNDGRGATEIGVHLYPRVPDMTLAETQSLTDGELFAIIKNGVRLTGMPSWGNAGIDGDPQTWQLVHFIRHLPTLTPAELDQMKLMNPVSPMEQEQQQRENEFLNGGEAPEATPSRSKSHTTRKGKS